MNETVVVKEILREIRDKYPSGKAKVSPAFVRNAMEQILRAWSPSRASARVRDEILKRVNLLMASSQKGMSATDLFAEINRIGRMLDDRGEGTRESEEAIYRLERQLRDLRTIVTSPDEIEKRFRDLQNQLASLREEVVDSQVPASEKQEDMLQKFLQADKRAFIIMPFQREFDNVWLGGIKPAASESHYVPLRVDEVNLSSLITDDIEKYSAMANVVIVDLTGNNPNVMFELGWSLAKDKSPIVICQGEHTSKVAFDVRGIRHIAYENSWLGVEQLKKKLKEFISATEQSRKPGASRKRALKMPLGVVDSRKTSPAA